MPEDIISGIAIDLDTNTIHVQLDTQQHQAPQGNVSSHMGTIDIGAGGRLVGIEVGDRYVTVIEPEAGTESLIRSAEVELGVASDPGTGGIVEIVIPRRGVGYEITWPSGNQ